MKKLFLAILIFFLPPLARCSVLSDAAAALGAGQWTTITTTNMTTAFFDVNRTTGVVSGVNSISFTAKMQFDWPRGSSYQGRIYQTGQGHHGQDPDGFLGSRYYDIATNTWVVVSNPAPFVEDLNHGYDHQAIDSYNRFHYRLSPNATGKLRRHNIDAHAAAVDMADFNFGQAKVAVGVDWFPERQSIIVYDATVSGDIGQLIEWRSASNTWSVISNNIQNGSPTAAALHCVVIYNPVWKFVLFGGGNNNPRIWRLDMDGAITRMADAPFPWGVGVGGTPGQGKITVDPVSGDFLFYFGDGGPGKFYKFVVTPTTPANGGTFTQLPDAPLNSGGNPFDHIAAVAIPHHGVIAYADCGNINACVFRLYKHTASSYSFAAKSAQSGVVRADSFDDPLDLYYARPGGNACDSDSFLTGHVNGNNPFNSSTQNRTSKGNVITTALSGNRCNYPTVDTAFKLEGAGSLKFVIPSESHANSSGSYLEAFQRVTEHGQVIDSCIGLSPCTIGSVFYFQFKQYFEGAMLTTVYETDNPPPDGIPDGVGGGWKQAIWRGNAPGDTGTVSVVQNNGALSRAPQIYGHKQDGSGDTDNYDTQAVRTCNNNEAGSTYPEPPCYRYRAAQWMEFTGRVKLGTCGANNSSVTLWVDGELTTHTNTAQWLSSCSQPGGFGQFELTPFYTNKNALQVHASANTWIDSLIISTQQIPVAFTSGAPAAPPSPPAAPTGFRRVP